MRFWMDFDAETTAEQHVLFGTPSYLEYQTHSLDPSGISYVYIMPLESSSFIVSACWNHAFDHFIEYIFHPKMGDDWISAYSEAWPTFGTLLRNAANGLYSAGSLVNFEDPDDGERKWHVATFVGNTMPKETYEEVADDPRIVDASQLVFLQSAELAEEMNSGKDIGTATKAKLLAKGAFSGYTQGLGVPAPVHRTLVR